MFLVQADLLCLRYGEWREEKKVIDLVVEKQFAIAENCIPVASAEM